MSAFYERYLKYHEGVMATLRANKDVSTIFPNPTDKGMTREHAIARILRDHLPTACNFVSGGFLFGQDGTKSGQLDLFITHNSCPRAAFENKHFACVDGVLAVVSVKSRLDTNEFIACLDEFAKLPDKSPPTNDPGFDIDGYDDWPLRIVLAFDGASYDTLADALINYQKQHKYETPHFAPHIVRVMGKWTALREFGERSFLEDKNFTDGVTLIRIIHDIQELCISANHCNFTYRDLLSGLSNLVYPNKPEINITV